MKENPSRSMMAAAAGLTLALLVTACSSDGSSDEVEEGVLSESLAAIPEQQSYEVQASGEVTKGETTAEFELSYEFVAPDSLRVRSQSTSNGTTDEAGLIIVGDTLWDLQDGVWTQQPVEDVDLSTFSAERIWGLVPFSTATLVDADETVNGVATKHYRFDEEARLPLESLAGALLAGTEPAFTGELTHFTIDIWTHATEGWPVRMELRAEGDGATVELDVNLTKSNDESIEVRPPSG